MSAKQKQELEEEHQKYIDIGYKDGYSDGYYDGYEKASSRYDEGYQDGYNDSERHLIEFLIDNPDELLLLLDESRK